jgi:hypothetical protein
VESEGALGTSWSSPDYADIRGNEYIYSNLDAGFDHEGFAKSADDVVMAYFRALSVRLTYQVGIEPNLFPAPRSIVRWWQPEAMVPFNMAFARVENHMEEMWILEHDNGVVWKGPGTEVLFAYKDFDYPTKGSLEILDALTNQNYKAETKLSARRMGIYLLKAA